jgi:ribulose-5-phosphate 4-epimerase/fuculose-1-phosphate aldolase
MYISSVAFPSRRRFLVQGMAALATAASARLYPAQAADDVDLVELTTLELAQANRILAREGILEVTGHISVRHPTISDRYLLSRSISSSLVTRADILAFNLDNTPVVPTSEGLFFERAIHGQIYEARPEINAVVHTHSPSVLPFTITDNKLIPVINEAVLIGTDIPVFDTRDEFGDTDTMITNVERGRALARKSRNASVVLLRGHGCVVLGESIPVAVHAAVYLERNARVQLEAQNLGKVKGLSEGEVELLARLFRSGGTGRAWEYWLSRANLSGI